MSKKEIPPQLILDAAGLAVDSISKLRRTPEEKSGTLSVKKQAFEFRQSKKQKRRENRKKARQKFFDIGDTMDDFLDFIEHTKGEAIMQIVEKEWEVFLKLKK